MSRVFRFTNEQFNVTISGNNKSEFDTYLCDEWNCAMANGRFRYDLTEVASKVLPGSHQYVALLNVKRATNRRAPEYMKHLNQPYDDSKFNFTKIKNEEILFELHDEGRKSETKDKIVINVSPADYGHSLIVPEIDCKQNQNLTLHGIELALQVMCLSSMRSFRIGFNSLCAHASVNHQHLHCYYTDCQLLAEVMTAEHLKGNLHLLNTDAPPGYGFLITKSSQLEDVARSVFTCTDYMRKNEIAHGIFICRGSPFSQEGQLEHPKSVIRILLWPRCKVIGLKPAEAAFNSAILEMAGHLLIKEKEYYNTVTDESAHACLRDTALPNEEFKQITSDLQQLL